eukprot:snap_masked-scaffold_64-processed-gene-0.46-mRNA-1 protein AED:1.00 eAED:1.00 QI:0/0/0/0/1/1/2/0/72
MEKIGDAEQPDQAFSPSICTIFSILVLQFSNDQIQATRFKVPDVQPIELQTILETNSRINSEQLVETNTFST